MCVGLALGGDNLSQDGARLAARLGTDAEAAVDGRAFLRLAIAPIETAGRLGSSRTLRGIARRVPLAG